MPGGRAAAGSRQTQPLGGYRSLFPARIGVWNLIVVLVVGSNLAASIATCDRDRLGDLDRHGQTADIEHRPTPSPVLTQVSQHLVAGASVCS